MRFEAFILATVVSLSPVLARAQTCDPAAERGAPGACAFGHACVNGACAPVCDPTCPGRQICTAPGVCSPDPAARAEDTAETCRNGIDDDGNGRGDCSEPACSLFVFCQQATITPPPAQQQQQTAVILPPGVIAGGAGTTFVLATPPPVAPPRDQSNPVFALTLNLGGAATFGPSVAFEFGGIVTFSVFARAMNAGALNYALSEDHSNWSDDEYVFGIGAGAAVRLYLSPGMRGMRGFWLGLAGEYQLNSWRKTSFYEDQSHGIVPTFQVGWRWIWGGFVLGLGASIGYRAELSHEVTYGPMACESCRSGTFEGSGLFYLLHLEIGFAI